MLRFWVAAGLACAFAQAVGCGGSDFTSTPATAGSGGTSDASAGTSGTGATAGSAGVQGTSGSSTGGSGGEDAGSGGTDGDGGTSGSSGRAGTGGVSGSSGTAGTAGAAGTSGSAGTAGTNGAGGTTGSGGTAGTGGDGGCARGLPGPPLVEVVTQNGGSYCIDSTEVTNAEYAAFLAANPSTSNQRAECTWNTSYMPADDWPMPVDLGRLPVGFVDWCDASAYCTWAGKRLCGKIGGGPNGYTDFADATKSQWYNACTAGGTKVWPYGNVYDQDACNGEGHGVATQIPVASLATCQGGVPGVYDMSGNVFEWEDSCNGNLGEGAICRARGGFYQSPAVPMRCDQSQTFYRNAASVAGPYLGIRCCSR